MNKKIKKIEEIETATSKGWPNTHPHDCVCKECVSVKDHSWIGGKWCECIHGKHWLEGDKFEEFGGRACKKCLIL